MVTMGAQARNAPPAVDTLRVVAYNIHHGEGMDGAIDLKRQGAVISGLEPDLVALQEVDQGTKRSGGVKQLRELSRLTGLRHSAFGKAIDFEGGEYGVAVLSRRPIVRHETYSLPHTSDREARAALTVDVSLRGRHDIVRFTSTHLDQGRESANRVVQAAFLNRVLARDGAPSILAGDLNSRVGTDVMQVFSEQWVDMFVEPPSKPDVRPRFRIDYVLARPASRWRTVDSQVVEDTLASDHRPLLVVLERLSVERPTE